MAFQGIQWDNETKTSPTNAQEIERTRQAKEASRQREADRIAAYERQKQQCQMQ